jgi:hypothetical protein
MEKENKMKHKKVRVPMLTENVSSKPYYFPRIKDTEQSNFCKYDAIPGLNIYKQPLPHP